MVIENPFHGPFRSPPPRLFPRVEITRSERIQGDEKVVGFSMTLQAGEQVIVTGLGEALRREEMARLGSRRGLYLGALFVRAIEGDQARVYPDREGIGGELVSGLRRVQRRRGSRAT